MLDTVFACAVALIIPACMIALGTAWARRAPRFGTSGFKTQRAQASPESWLFAHKHLGRRLIPLGGILAAASITAILTIPATPCLVLLALELVQVVAFVCVGLETELALRKNFSDETR